jgi:hypothetical protein
MGKEMDNIEQLKIEALRELLIEGEQSGICDYNFEELLAELDEISEESCKPCK